MEYRAVGRSGLKISALSLGSWLTIGERVNLSATRELVDTALSQGVNFIDTAETYSDGGAELFLGEALNRIPRKNYVLSTKLFWGGSGPNDLGHSFKRLHEGLSQSLRRLQTDYVDLLYCHRHDPTTPIEETVRGMDILMKQGKILYWGTSEWDYQQIAEAISIAEAMGVALPIVEQPEYNLFHRRRVEVEYDPLYPQIGLTTWSPLAGGILSGKYGKGTPQGTRLEFESYYRPENYEERAKSAEKMRPIAEELGVTMAQLAIGWCLTNPHVSSVLLGASSKKQLIENLGALEAKDKLCKNEALLSRLKALPSPW